MFVYFVVNIIIQSTTMSLYVLAVFIFFSYYNYIMSNNRASVTLLAACNVSILNLLPCECEVFRRTLKKRNCSMQMLTLLF